MSSAHLVMALVCFSTESDRRTVFIALTVISLVGTVLFFLIRKQEDTKAPGDDDSTNEILGESS